MEFKALQREPVEGFLVTIQDDDFYTWQVAIFGPPDTPYQGGYFKVRCQFNGYARVFHQSLRTEMAGYAVCLRFVFVVSATFY